jgi:hypothetical protein
MIIALLALAVTPASASGKPMRASFANPSFTLAAGLACSFAVHGEAVVNQEVSTTFPAEPNGDVVQLVTGYLVERFTNVDTGKSITVNVSGPAKYVLHLDGSTTFIGLASEFLPFFPTDIPPGPRFFINYGKIVITITSAGQFILVSQTGTQFDICAALS